MSYHTQCDEHESDQQILADILFALGGVNESQSRTHAAIVTEMLANRGIVLYRP